MPATASMILRKCRK